MMQSTMFSDGNNSHNNYNFLKGSTMLFEPPKKLKSYYYRCDNKFHLDEVLDMFEEDENKNIGICLVSGKELLVYLVKMNNYIDIILLKKMDVHLINKHGRGGQSQMRYCRIADSNRSKYAEDIASTIVNSYLINNHTKCIINKLVIAGPSYMKNDVIDTDIFQKYMKSYLFKIVNTNDFDNTTAHILAESLIDEIKITDIKEIENEINNLVTYESDMLAFGKTECLEIIINNNISTIFINKTIIDDDINELIKDKEYVIITESSVLNLYGGCVGKKKYKL